MKFKYLSLLCLVSLSFLLTGFFGSSPEKTVRNAKLQGSKETLGELLEKYKYAINPKWSVQKAKDGTEYVEFKAVYDSRGIVTSLYEKQKLPTALLDYISKLPPLVFIVGKFLTDDGKITSSIVQLTDKTDVMHAQMSLPMGIFTQQVPIPETFILDDWEKYYKYQVTKFLFSHNYGSNISFYTLCPNLDQYSEKFPVRIELNKIEYDDTKMQMKVSGDLSLLDYRLTFSVKNGDGGSKYSVNGKPLEDQKAFQELRTYASNLGEMFPELAKAPIVQTIPIEGTAELGSRWPGINLNTKVTERISFDITSFEPFRCKWQLMDDVQDLFSPETKKFLSRWEKIQNNWVRRRAQSVPEFGKGTQVLHYEKGEATSLLEGMSAEEAAAIAAGKIPVKLRPITYDLYIFYNENKPEEMRFNFTFNNNSTIEGTCEPNGSWIKCRSTPQDSNKQLEFEVPNNDSFELRSITFSGSPHEYIRMQFKDITTIPAEESIQKLSPTLSQTSNGNGNGSAANEEFIPGRYAGKRNDSEPIMQFFLDGTGYYSDVKSVHFQWEKNKEGIKIIYFNDMEEPIEAATKTAVLTSPTSFTYDKGTYNLIKESIPETYAYDKSGFSGTILIQKSDPGEDYLYVKLDTFTSQSNDKCQIAGYCEDMEGGWLCTGKMPDDEMDVYFSITFLSPDKLNLEPGSDEKRMCGKSVEYTGIYQRAKK